MLSGEATIPTDVERLLDGARPHLTVTELPYGVHDDAQLTKCSWRLGNNSCRQGEQQSPTIRTPMFPSAEGRLPESLHFAESDVILGVVRARRVHKIGYGHNCDWAAAYGLPVSF